MPVSFAWNETHAGHRATRHMGRHVERPERLDGVLRHLNTAPIRRHLEFVSGERARLEELYLAHDEEHVQRVASAIGAGFNRLDPDTFITGKSMNIALDAVGALMAVTRHVLDGRSTSGFAAIRPPGHHATQNQSMGFCIFSNVAVAARWAQREAGLDRVLIVDFDVHHGNGTQHIFYDDPGVMYMSVHQSPFYPGTGAADERGAGDGAHTTVNVPLPSGAGDETYNIVFRDILRPFARDFDPELIFLSAGYDAHWKDPLGGMRVTTNGFAEIVREVSDWAGSCCDGRIVAALEGGYHIDALTYSVAATLEVLNDPDAKVEDPCGDAPGEPAVLEEHLRKVEQLLRQD